MIVPALSVPLAPDGAAGRRLLRDELARPEYAAAEPSPFDRLATAFLTWFTGLFDPRAGAAPPVLLAIALAVLAAALVIALLLFGLPRVNRRSGVHGLFGEDDRRSADELRRAADAALRAGDHRLAVLERFRALARGLDERALVQLFPGTTATVFARSAAAPFPSERDALRAAARLFDAVRYADADAGRADAESVRDLDERLVRARPRLEAPVPA